MTCMAVGDNTIVISKQFHIDCFDSVNHNTFNIPLRDNDSISDIVISSDCKYLAMITSSSKKLLLYDLPITEKYKCFALPRSASKIRFTTDNLYILVADKSGDVLIYDIKEESSGTKLLGHLSLLLDVLQTNDRKYIITSDRDEKIRVSCYPNTYNIQTYCLGHKEFVNHIELLPHNCKYLISSSGDGTLKCWDFEKGTLYYSIDLNLDISKNELKADFIKEMDKEGIEVNTLPVVHCTLTQLSHICSIIAATVHTSKEILIYSLETLNNQFSHKLEQKLTLDRFPEAVTLHNSSLYVYDDVDCCVSIFKISCNNESLSCLLDKKIKMFEKIDIDITIKENNYDYIKVLYKRKFDNVQEYQERKRQRLEKTSQ